MKRASECVCGGKLVLYTILKSVIVECWDCGNQLYALTNKQAVQRVLGVKDERETVVLADKVLTRG